MGIPHIVMITGDGEKTAANVAARLRNYRVLLSSASRRKVRHCVAFRKEGRRVLMIGDGINDTPALSAASVGVSLSDGADLAKEVASVVLLGSDLTHLPLALELGRRTYARIPKRISELRSD